MITQTVFESEKEINRLQIQNEMLAEYENKGFGEIFKGKSDLCVLDIGCCDGEKTVSRFANGAVSKVIGIEYNEEPLNKAREERSNGKFSFCRLDVESDIFFDDLTEIMKYHKIEGFDVIYLSFVLMHLKNPVNLLKKLFPYIKNGGYIVIAEANENLTCLKPDKDKLCEKFVYMLGNDKYAGNRYLGEFLPKELIKCGYIENSVWCNGVSAKKGEKDRKEKIFEIYFSYLPEDVKLLLSEEPNNAEYQKWSEWIQENYGKLKSQIIDTDSEITMGIKIMSFKKEEK